MAAVASAVNYRVADSKRLALQPHRFRPDIDRGASIDSFSRFLLVPHDRIYYNRIARFQVHYAVGEGINRNVESASIVNDRSFRASIDTLPSSMVASNSNLYE